MLTPCHVSDPLQPNESNDTANARIVSRLDRPKPATIRVAVVSTMLPGVTLCVVGAFIAIQSLARAATSRLLDLCYPATCAACDASCDTGMSLCCDCEPKLAELEQAAACPRCAMPLAVHGSPCPWCWGKGL